MTHSVEHGMVRYATFTRRARALLVDSAQAAGDPRLVTLSPTT